MLIWLFVASLCFPIFILFSWVNQYFYGRVIKNVENKHVVITGGSSGIGKCVAILAAKQGAHVTIIARDVKKLEEAKKEIVEACKNHVTQKIRYLSLDIGKSYEDVDKSLADLETTMGPIYMLINCAGTAVCGKIEDTSIENVKKMMDLNFMGTYYCIKAVIPKMKSAKEGAIVLTSSQGGLLGIFGMSAYCSTKFALRGLAESLVMELTPYNISVTLSLPPDTDTPGFAIEQQTKPLETKLISETGGLVAPEDVARKLLDDALAGKFFSFIGMESFMITNLCSGMSPITSISELIIQSLIMGILKITSAFYHIGFQRIILKCMEDREQYKKIE